MNKSPNYKNYIDGDMIINEFIFAEFCYQLLKDNVKNPEEYLDELKLSIINPEPSVIWRAMKFRYKNKNRKMSMVDCISYVMAIELGVRFLTGDKEFQDLDNVEFIKK